MDSLNLKYNLIQLPGYEYNLIHYCPRQQIVCIEMLLMDWSIQSVSWHQKVWD